MRLMVLAAFGFPQQVPENLAYLSRGDAGGVHGQGESLQILGAALVGSKQGGAKAALPIPGHRKAESAVLSYQVAPVVAILPPCSARKASRSPSITASSVRLTTSLITASSQP